jgi:hypothetical protein
MGWRQRDYAKWTDEERRRFLGTSSAAPGRRSDVARVGTSATEPRRFVRPGVGLAIAASAALFGLGHFPQHHPILPALYFAIPKIPHVSSTHSLRPNAQDPVGRIRLPSSGRVGGFLTIQGRLPDGEEGTVSVQGAFSQQPWRLLAAVPSASGSYQARIQLTRPGLLHLRVVYPDGHRAVGSMRVAR